MKKTAPPPPPPALAAKPKHPTYKALYDYDGSVAGSIPLVKDTVYYVVSINGKWGLTKTLDESREGWSPIDYLQECAPPANLGGGKSPPPPPPPPVQQQQQQPAAVAVGTSNPESSNSSYVTTSTQPTTENGSLGNSLADALKAKKTEETTLAGSLADALKKRQGATRVDSDEEEEEDDDDDW